MAKSPPDNQTKKEKNIEKLQKQLHNINKSKKHKGKKKLNDITLVSDEIKMYNENFGDDDDIPEFSQAVIDSIEEEYKE